MKIGLLTFHTAANFGAVLQAYALQEYLMRIGYDAEYIDYQSPYRRVIYDMPYRVRSSFKSGKIIEAVYYLLGMPFINIRKKKFKQFSNEFLHISKKTYYNEKELESTNALYDFFMVGSDQVWNPSNNGKDMAYMLNFVNDEVKKISYASSFGLSEVPDYIKDDYARYLQRIRHISTREQTGVQIIKLLTGRDAQLVLDPVFLLDKEQWKDLCDDYSFEGRFVFFYTNRKNQIDSFMKIGYDMKGLKQHKLSRFTYIKDFVSPNVKIKYGMSPIEFLANVYRAQMVVSASFHCICFCIIFNKPFICFLTGNDGKDERLKTLLLHFGLMDRVYKDDMTKEDVLRPIDWIKVNAIIKEKQMESIHFLLKAFK